VHGKQPSSGRRRQAGAHQAVDLVFQPQLRLATAVRGAAHQPRVGGPQPPVQPLLLGAEALQKRAAGRQGPSLLCLLLLPLGQLLPAQLPHLLVPLVLAPPLLKRRPRQLLLSQLHLRPEARLPVYIHTDNVRDAVPARARILAHPR
jgi:hypothetical protein